MVLDQDRLPTPELSLILELTHQFLFLRVHADNGIAAVVELLPLMAQVMKLLLTLRTAAGTQTLAVGVQCVVQFPQEPTHRVGANPQSQLGQFPTDGSQAFAGPHATTSCRIPGRILPE